MQKLKLKIPLQHFLQETLMLTPSIGGLVAIQLLKALIEHLLSSLGLSQVVSEPTNFEPNKKPLIVELVHLWIHTVTIK